MPALGVEVAAAAIDEPPELLWRRRQRAPSDALRAELDASATAAATSEPLHRHGWGGS